MTAASKDDVFLKYGDYIMLYNKDLPEKSQPAKDHMGKVAMLTCFG